MKNHLPKVLFIDWHKTLSDCYFWSHLMDPVHPYHKHFSMFNNCLFIENRYLLDPWSRGEYSTEQICSIVSKQTEIDFQIIFNELVFSCQKLTLINSEILDLISKIRGKGIKVIMATDNMDTFRKYTMPSLDLENFFDDFLISCELGCLKFETQENSIPFFDKYLQNNNLDYSDVVLFDDNFDKSGVYQKLGFEIKNVNKEKRLIDYLHDFYLSLE